MAETRRTDVETPMALAVTHQTLRRMLAAVVIGEPLRADEHWLGTPLTERSTPGNYFVITASRTVYRVDIESDRAFLTVTRYPYANTLLLDGEPLTGVRAFHFDTDSGVGQIEWWKTNPADYDHPDLPYVGTKRTTSRVMLILALRSSAEKPAPSHRPDIRAEVELFLDGLRTALAAVDSADDFKDVLTFLMEHGHRISETDGEARDGSTWAGPMTSDEPSGTLPEVVAEVRELLSALDDVSWPDMDARFYMHGYDELHLAVERLLEALARDELPDA